MCRARWLSRGGNPLSSTAQSPEEQSGLTPAFSSPFYQRWTGSTHDELVSDELREQLFLHAFLSKKIKKKLLFEFAGSALWLLLVISIYAFILVKSCPLRKCLSSGTLTHSVPARALPPSLLVIDYCVKGSADAVVACNNRELVSAVQEDAICLGFALDRGPPRPPLQVAQPAEATPDLAVSLHKH